MSRKKIISLILIVFFILYFIQLGRLARNYSQSYRFGDEDAHMVGGSLFLKGYQIYQDFAGNHQPLTYLFPAAVQKITQPATLYQFIARHREAVFAYSLVWNGLYLLVFGRFVFFFTLIFEICRYVLLGNKVLGEVLAVYPLVMMFGLVVKKTVFGKPLNIVEIVLFSLSSFLAAFSLLPVWPTIIVLNCLLFFAYWKKGRALKWQLIAFIIPTLILFIIVPFRQYFQETIIENYTYVIPKMNLDKITFPGDYLRMAFLPFTGLHADPSFVESLAVGFLILYAFMFYLAYRMKKLRLFFVILVALILANNRTVILKYGNFHALPWLGVYFFIPIIFINFFRQPRTKESESKNFYLMIFTYYFLLVAMAVGINLFGWTDYYGYLMFNLKNDLVAEHNINYHDSNKYGLAIKALSAPGDRLQALPNDTLVFWVADIAPAAKPLESYDWQYDIPEYKKEIVDVFTARPPEFYLLSNLTPLKGTIIIHNLIARSLNDKYVRIGHLGKPSILFVLKTKLAKISDEQWKEFNYLLFDKPVK